MTRSINPQYSDNANYEVQDLDLSSVTRGKEISIGTGFTANSFRHADFNGLMDPLIMADHYVMTESTFGAHPHAGISAVSLLLEDSVGRFHNRDSLGNDFDLMPGDLYWLKAGRGAVHDESPRSGSRTHGLQVFVNLPAAMKFDEPSSMLVRAEQMPVVEGKGFRVRVALGESNGVQGLNSPALPMTILDGKLDANAAYQHKLPAGHSAWIIAIGGSLALQVGESITHLEAGQAMAIASINDLAESTLRICNSESEAMQFVLFSGVPVNERFVQEGPFAMSSEEDLQKVKQEYAAGNLGSI